MGDTVTRECPPERERPVGTRPVFPYITAAEISVRPSSFTHLTNTDFSPWRSFRSFGHNKAVSKDIPACHTVGQGRAFWAGLYCRYYSPSWKQAASFDFDG